MCLARRRRYAVRSRRRPLAMTSSEAPVSAAMAIQSVACPLTASARKIALSPIDSEMFVLMLKSAWRLSLTVNGIFERSSPSRRCPPFPAPHRFQRRPSRCPGPPRRAPARRSHRRQPLPSRRSAVAGRARHRPLRLVAARRARRRFRDRPQWRVRRRRCRPSAWPRVRSPASGRDPRRHGRAAAARPRGRWCRVAGCDEQRAPTSGPGVRMRQSPLSLVPSGADAPRRGEGSR